MDIIRHSILLIVLLPCILAGLADGNPRHHYHGSTSPDHRGNSDGQHPYYHAAVAGNGISDDDEYEYDEGEEDEIPWTWADVLSGRDHPIYGHPVDIDHTVYYTKTVWVDPPAKTTAAARHHNY